MRVQAYGGTAGNVGSVSWGYSPNWRKGRSIAYSSFPWRGRTPSFTFSWEDYSGTGRGFHPRANDQHSTYPLPVAEGEICDLRRGLPGLDSWKHQREWWSRSASPPGEETLTVLPDSERVT